MKTLIILLAVVGITGCATRAQTAALAGAVTGAVIATEVNRAHNPQPVIVHTPRCYNQFLGHDYYGRVVYTQVCR